MTILGERTEQLYIFCHVTGFTSDFLSFVDVELIRFFHGAIQLSAVIGASRHQRSWEAKEDVVRMCENCMVY